MTIENERLARRWFEEVWNGREPSTIDELLHDEIVHHAESGTIIGKQTFKDLLHDVFLTAFPDLRMTLESTVAEGDEVAVRWACVGTHLGDSLGFPASNRPVSFRGVTWIRFAEGKVVEGWDCWNQGGVIAALRAADPPSSDPRESLSA